tara:strand:+ start:24 stop:356 length:333 start_codon:yes stop_codon:yes gene_type:complete
MSFESWKKEFYDKGDLTKWIGLRLENLKKHDFIRQQHKVITFKDGVFHVGSSTCNLCKEYYRNSYFNSCCDSCPLYQLRDNRCDRGSENPFSEFVKNGNPEPMIQLLEKL